MLEDVEILFDKPATSNWPGSRKDVAGLSGVLGTGVFVLEIQTPSTSIPLSMARMPKGTSLTLGCLTELPFSFSSSNCARFLSATTVNF